MLLQYFESKCNAELASLLKSQEAEWQHMHTGQRVKEGLKMRLEMNAPYIGEQHMVNGLVSICKLMIPVWLLQIHGRRHSALKQNLETLPLHFNKLPTSLMMFGMLLETSQLITTGTQSGGYWPVSIQQASCTCLQTTPHALQTLGMC